ncbi:MAG: hypothetical protein N3A01_03650 [Bacteroidales bacterium]|nr:hypothetical protein [Bacteroidales bacterium]
MKKLFLLMFLICYIFFSCSNKKQERALNNEDTTQIKKLTIKDRINEYVTITLKPDISNLSANEKKMLSYLIDAANVIDEIFWLQSYGNKDTLFNKLKTEEEKLLCEINYGPWDRLNNNEPFIEGVGKKPIGAGFFPPDIKYFPFLSMKFEDKISMYTVIKKDEEGNLYTEPYHKAYANYLTKASNYLLMAADLCPDKDFRNFLRKRAESLLNDDYYSSDLLWMDLKNNKIDIVIGPVNCEEDQFIHTKTTYEAYILLTDIELTKKYERLNDYLEKIKNSIPLPENYLKQIIFSKPNVVIYDGVYFAGWPNAGAKQISINYPKDGRILIEKGCKKLQFKNVQRAKFDNILLPLAKILIAPEYHKNITFEAFFINNIAYEISDAVVVKGTVTNKGPAKEALKDYYPTINSLKADLLYIYIITQLNELGALKETTLENHYYSYLANLLRSIRFGSVIAQGSSSLIALNMLLKLKAFEKTKEGFYIVNMEKMKEVITKLTKDVLKVLAEGDIPTAKSWIDIYGNISPEMSEDIKKIKKAGIPVDIRYIQGKSVLNL